MLTAAMTVAKTVTQDELLQLIDKAAAEKWTTLDLAGKGLNELPPEIGKLTNLNTLVLGRWDKTKGEYGESLDNNLKTLPDEIGELTELRSLLLYDNQFAELPEVIGKLSELRSLNLRNNQLKELPEFIGQLTNLRSLDLRSNQLTELPDFLGRLTNLRSLDLRNNRLKELPEFLGQLTNLRSLALSGYQRKELPKFIGQLTNLRSLVLWNTRLEELPEFIGQLTNLQLLFLWNTRLEELPEFIGQLTNLRSLVLWNIQLTELPEFLGQLTNLRSLDLIGHQLKELPEFIGHLTNLRSLSLHGNQITELPKFPGQLTSLQTLHLSNVQLTELPEFIEQLTNLRSLDLSNNQLKELPEFLGLLTNLRSLNLGSNQLKELPKFLGHLTNLRSLDLSNNQLKGLPEFLGLLTNLRTLNLSSNQPKGLPEFLGHLANLRTLDLSNNQLKGLPEFLRHLTNLRTLNLSSNQPKGLPEFLGHLANLRTLDLSNNQLKGLPEFLGHLTNLRTLNLSSNQLKGLPEFLGHLTNLRTLDLSSNQLKGLPEFLGHLTNLRTLNLSSNQLKELPEFLGHLTNLRTLNLNSNQLRELPEVVSRLPNLTTLNLWDNKISLLPKWIRELTTIERLDLRANRLSVPPEILGSKNQYGNPVPAAEVIDYYFQEKSDTPLYEAKLLIVGEGGAGKTTLAKKLQDPDYKLKEDEKSTEGIEVLPYNFNHPDGPPCKVNIWDFGGQEIYHATHQFFLTERAIYALVTDSRQGNTDFYFWLNVIQLHGADSPVILIKNEKQGRPCSVPDLQLRGQFANLKESIETDLSENRNLETIKNTVEQYISNLSHVGDPLPKTWANVRSVLENQALGSDNYIDIREYRQICEAQGITKRIEQERLSRFLHNLGVFLHFQAIPQLSKTIFLTPAWSTDAVYKVLEAQKVRKDCGRFSNEDLDQIWKDNEYKDVRGELLALMQQFEVCYEITGRNNHYIAPHLLEANLPAELNYKETWDSQDNLVVTYHYPFKPKNIFPRFIVSLHRYIEKQRLVWKHGVVLIIGNARAEIIEDARYDAANIHIRICGTDKKRLLSIIGHELERIHTSFEKLKYETLIPCNCAECKSDETPYQFAYKVLQKSLAKHNLEVQCQKSFDMVNVRRLIDDVIEPQTYLDKTYADLDPDPSIARSQSIRSANPKTSDQSPFSNKLDITVNFPEQRYEESSNINIGGNVTDSNVIKGDKNTVDTSSKDTHKYGDTYNQSGPGDNIGGDKVLNDKINTQINNTDLATAARDIKALFAELDQSYDKTTPFGQMQIATKTIEAIESKPTVKKRLLNAVKEGGTTALEEMVEHPAIKPVVAAIKGYIDT